MKHTRAQLDVIVIGGGHAGTEAVLAAARAGAAAALVTNRIATIGQMSCNPAIGGIGKTHLVREIDALDGLMGKAADAAAIHYRLLNASKGPAVHGSRVQCDRGLYQTFVQSTIVSSAITLIEDEVSDILVDSNRVCGVRLANGGEIAARAVVLTTGTFLNGMIHVGHKSRPGGRINEPASNRLADRLRDLGAPTGRLKTGTPPRLDGRTIDWGEIGAQPSDTDPAFMSFLTKERRNRQISCGVTETNDRTHDIVRAGFKSSPIVTGAISGVGPRYCPSIEDKVVRFPQRSGHRVFLEPETLDGYVVYPNGVSTSLDEDSQVKMIRSIAGLSKAEITIPGYAIEYDYVDPRSLGRDLQFKELPGLYLAGQINGTTGYEEAAAQGLVSGLNAAMLTKGTQPVMFAREDCYIGVLIDDLVSRGVSEPYRMFTSRVERRLFLRPDNADQRLTPIGRGSSCVGDTRWRIFLEKKACLDSLRSRLEAISITSARARALGYDIGQTGIRKTAWDLLSLHRMTIEDLISIWPDLADVKPLLATIAAEAVYEPYLPLMSSRNEMLAGDLSLRIPASVRFDQGAGLSSELIEKLCRLRPTSLEEASKIEGMTPVALEIVRFMVRRAMVYVE